MLRVTIDPIGSQKNLQISQQMTDNEENQNDSRDRDDEFFPDGGAVKSGNVSHKKRRGIRWQCKLKVTVLLSSLPSGDGGKCLLGKAGQFISGDIKFCSAYLGNYFCLETRTVGARENVTRLAVICVSISEVIDD